MPGADDADAPTDGDDGFDGDDADDRSSGFSPPPHPDDRLWRHPSELAQHPISPIGTPVATPSDRGRPWGTVAAVAAVTALVVGVGVAFTLDGGSDDPGAPAAPPLNPTAGSPPTYGGVETAMGHGLAPTLVLLETSDNDGSGVLVNEDGIVLTSAVLLDDQGVKAHLANGETVEATVIGVDPVTGVGVLRLPGRGYSAARMAEATDLAPGGTAYLVGAGTSGGADITVGVIGVSTYVSGERQATLEGIIEIRGEAAPQALGGPLVDSNGTVIGITTATGRGPGESSYITPAEVTHKVMRDLIETGDVYHSWLGIRGLTVSDAPVETPAAGGSDGGGALVASVFEGSPAEAAGLQTDDVIVQVDRSPIQGMPDLYMALRARSPGEQVTLTLVRDGSPLSLSVVLGDLPSM